MKNKIKLHTKPLVASTLLLALPAHAQFTQNEIQKLLASDKADADFFGESVAIDGDTAVIGAYLKSDGGTYENGAAYIFARSGGTWRQQAKLLASDRTDQDRFGNSVAIDGDTVVIGASSADGSGTSASGAAYVFTRSTGSWTEQAKLLASDRARLDGFGRSVAIDGDTVVIGADGEDDSGTTRSGAGYVFTPIACTWTQQY